MRLFVALPAKPDELKKKFVAFVVVADMMDFRCGVYPASLAHMFAPV
jgi:hypothetical protein